MGTLNRKRVEVLVQIVEVDREPKFSKMKRDITVFKSILSVPIYLIGLHERVKFEPSMLISSKRSYRGKAL